MNNDSCLQTDTNNSYISYNLIIKPKELSKTIIFDMSYRSKYIQKMKIESLSKNFDIKLFGKGEIINISESLLLYKNEFDFSNMMNSIIDQLMTLEVKYIGTETKMNHSISVTFYYVQISDRLLCNNLYTNFESDIISDIKKFTKAKYIIFTTDREINSINFSPKFISNEELLDSYVLTPTNENYIRFDIPEFFNENLDNYNLFIDCTGKLGVNIYA